MSKIRVRFAPSPTGYLHIGSLRTVLFNYLLAKSQNGKLILRIDDTDQKREVKDSIEKLISILGWVGIKFDEGPVFIRPDNTGIHPNEVKDIGKYGPYIQSQRLKIYKKYTEQLLKSGGAYRCFCSPERLSKMREDQQKKKLPPRYDRSCRDLSENEINEKITRPASPASPSLGGRAKREAGEKLASHRDAGFVIRQKIPLKGEIKVKDELRGEIKFKAEDLDDHVLIKSNGIPTYQFANVVDDHEMKISHVLRGDEWIASFPRNILLYEAFGWNPPKFIHLPLVLDKKGGKLSKRQGDVAVEDFREKGYLPEALINFCALLGWHPKDDNEILSMDKLIKEFDIKGIGISPAVFDIEKLDYLNGYYIRQLSLDKLTELCLPYLEDKTKKSKIYLKKVVALEQERLKKLSEIGELTEFFFVDKLEYQDELLSWKKLSIEQAKKNLKKIYELLEKIPDKNWTNDSIEEDIRSYLEARELKVGEYLWPMRVALTGRKASPGPFDVAEVLGKVESLKRIKKII